MMVVHGVQADNLDDYSCTKKKKGGAKAPPFFCHHIKFFC